MARPKSKFNQSNSSVIEENVLKQDPEGLPEAKVNVAVIKEMPKMERVVFRNDRDPGMPLEFHFHSATHPLHHYKLLHGKEYTLSVEIIEHLESRRIPIYVYRRDADGMPQLCVNGYRHYYVCKPVRDYARAA
jgi:hypothetical protein